jgi:hypothetical protein
MAVLLAVVPVHLRLPGAEAQGLVGLFTTDARLVRETTTC